MTRFKVAPVIVMLGITVPGICSAADYCVAVGGGFGGGGASFIGKGFVIPAKGTCKPWSGFTKAGADVIAISAGTGCLSSDGKVLELSIHHTNPSYFGGDQTGADHIRFCPAGSTGCPVGGGSDVGSFADFNVAPQACTAKLIKLPSTHT